MQTEKAKQFKKSLENHMTFLMIGEKVLQLDIPEFKHLCNTVIEKSPVDQMDNPLVKKSVERAHVYLELVETLEPFQKLFRIHHEKVLAEDKADTKNAGENAEG